MVMWHWQTVRMDTKPFAESCLRNRDPILAVLQPLLAGRKQVLEIGSGTGQHAVHFAAALPQLVWQCSDHADHLPGMRLWLDEAGLPNTPPPIALQAVPGHGLQPAPPAGQFDAVFTANTLHIMSWEAVCALLDGVAALLPQGGVFAAYGPFKRDGRFTSDSNRDFDAWLKARDAASGIRDREAVDAQAAVHGLRRVHSHQLPANNELLVWQRGAGS